MNDADFNAELVELLNTERKKLPYTVESVDEAMRLLATSFANHVESLKDFYSMNTVEAFLSSFESDDGTILSEDDDGDFQTPFSRELMSLLQEDAERYDAPLTGELLVGGNGVYIQDNTGLTEDDERPTLEELQDGMTIVGEFMGYAALPGIIYDEAEQRAPGDDFSEDLEPWLKLYDARVYDATGTEIVTISSLFIPLSSSEFTFGTVVRNTKFGHEQINQQPVEIDLKTYFASDFIQGEFLNAENDLQHNEYTSDEERTVREEYQDEFMLYMEMVNGDNRFVVDASHVYFQGCETSGVLEGVTAYYLQPVLVKIEGVWRLCHAFHILSGDEKAKLLTFCRSTLEELATNQSRNLQ